MAAGDPTTIYNTVAMGVSNHVITVAVIALIITDLTSIMPHYASSCLLI